MALHLSKPSKRLKLSFRDRGVKYCLCFPIPSDDRELPAQLRQSAVHLVPNCLMERVYRVTVPALVRKCSTKSEIPSRFGIVDSLPKQRLALSEFTLPAVNLSKLVQRA